MDINSSSFLSYIERVKNSELPNYSTEIQKQKGVKKLLRKIIFKLTWWMIEPLMIYSSNYNESNYATLMNFYNYTKHLEDKLERTIAEHGNTLELYAGSITACNNTLEMFGETITAQGNAMKGYGETITAQGNAMKGYDETISAQGNAMKGYGETITAQGSAIYELHRHMIRSLEDYNQWIAQNEPTEYELKYQRGHRFKVRPTISLFISIDDKQVDQLKKVANSVKAQTYDAWNLYIVSDDNVVVNKLIEQYAEEERIECCHIAKVNRNNSVLEFATQKAIGNYTGFLSINDELTPFALYEVVKRINEFPGAALIYGDEDSIKDNKRCEPIFKPAFAPDTLMSTNYIGNFFIVKESILTKATSSMEYIGDMYYELLLRSYELTDSIYNIPMILNHRSLADIDATDSHAVVKGANAQLIKSHITRKAGLESTVEYTGVDDIYKVDYEVIENPKVSILIPNKDNTELLRSCIELIQKQTSYDNYEIVVIENNSTDENTYKYYKGLEESSSQVRVVYYPEKEFNYQKIINFGTLNTDTDYIMQLNNDIELLTPNWLELMLGYAQRSDVGAVGAKLLYPDMSIQHAGGMYAQGGRMIDHVFRYMPRNAGSYKNQDVVIQNMSWVTGACLLCKKDIFEQVGRMDEDFEVVFGDVDLCVKLRNIGKRIVYHPHVELIHHEAKTRGFDNTSEKIIAFQMEHEHFISKWQQELESGDPYFNPRMERVLPSK